MTVMTFTSREFNQDPSKIKRASLSGPVFITDRGHLAHVLLTVETYQQLIQAKESIVDLISTQDVANIEFEPVKLTKKLYKPTDFD